LRFGGTEVATLDKVSVDLMVVLAPPHAIHQVMRLSRGAIIELDAPRPTRSRSSPTPAGRQRRVLVDRNRIAVEVKQMLPKLPGVR